MQPPLLQTNRFNSKVEVKRPKNFIMSFFKGKKELIKTSEPQKLVSCDLSSFTDLFSPGTILGALRALNAANLYPLITESEITMPDSTQIKPRVPLMGFRGCFELASLIHNAIISTYVTRTYALCGDDVVGVLPLSVYEEAVNSVGLVLNRAKTVVSDDTCVFCGGVYFRGCDVSPVIPPIYTIVCKSGKDQFAGVQALVDRMRYMYPLQRKFVRRWLYRVTRTWSRKRISLLLPTKLGGVKLRHSSQTLESVLDIRSERVIASHSVTVESAPEENRGITLPGLEPISEPVVNTVNLTKEKTLTLPRPRNSKETTKSVPLIGTEEILDYYYTGKPIAEERLEVLRKRCKNANKKDVKVLDRDEFLKLSDFRRFSLLVEFERILRE
jgi:hypothetical protein